MLCSESKVTLNGPSNETDAVLPNGTHRAVFASSAAKATARDIEAMAGTVGDLLYVGLVLQMSSCLDTRSFLYHSRRKACAQINTFVGISQSPLSEPIGVAEVHILKENSLTSHDPT